MSIAMFEANQKAADALRVLNTNNMQTYSYSTAVR